jgi:hypothetical protein
MLGASQSRCAAYGALACVATRMQQSRCALAYGATRMLSEECMQQSRCALAYVGDADASEECMHAAQQESLRPRVRRRRGCFPKSACMPRSTSRCALAYVGDADAFRRVHACRAAGVAAPSRTSATRMLSEECMHAAQPSSVVQPSFRCRRAARARWSELG